LKYNFGMRKIFSTTIFIIWFSINPLFAVSLDDFKYLTPATQTAIQYDLRAIGYQIGPVDGEIGKKSFAAILSFSKANDINLQKISVEKLIVALENKARGALRVQKRNLPRTWSFKIDFEKKSQLKKFEADRITNCNYSKCEDDFTPIEFLKEANGNTYIALSSTEGLRSNLAGSASKPSDRQEIGTKSIEFDLEGTTLWYGFKSKYPEKTVTQNAKGITFTQIKEVTKWRNNSTKIDCSKGVIFHVQVGNDPIGFGGIYNGDGMRYPKRIENIRLLETQWSTFKFGIKLSRENGWIEAYRNGKLLWRDDGPNLVTKFNGKCDKGVNWRTAHLRVGPYRSNGPKGTDTIHYDDFIASHSEEEVDSFLK